MLKSIKEIGVSFTEVAIQNNYIHFGNRCGHEPNSPRVYQRGKNKKTPPDAIYNAFKNIENYYDNHDNWLEHLEFSQKNPKRKKRSEAREAIVSVGRVLLDHADLSTLKIVSFNPEKGAYRHLKVSRIAHLAGISIKRCYRALTALKNAGYLEFQYRVEMKEDGNFKALTAIKRLNPTFFYHLGITAQKLNACRRFVSKKLKKLYGDSKDKRKLSFKLRQFSGGGRNNKNKHKNPLDCNFIKKPNYTRTADPALHKRQIKWSRDQIEYLSQGHSPEKIEKIIGKRPL